VLRDCAPAEHAKGTLQRRQAGFWTPRCGTAGWQVQAAAGCRERAAQQSGQTKLTCPRSAPRRGAASYQRQGVAWLQFLRENKSEASWGEMGSGQTAPALAFIHPATRTEASGPVLMFARLRWFQLGGRGEEVHARAESLALHGTGRHEHFETCPERPCHHQLRAHPARCRAVTRAGVRMLVLDEAQPHQEWQTRTRSP